jgi:hypothetical protein
MKYYQAKYKDLDGVEHTLPAQTQKQLNNAYEHIANSGEYESGSWVDFFVYEE